MGHLIVGSVDETVEKGHHTQIPQTFPLCQCIDTLFEPKIVGDPKQFFFTNLGKKGPGFDLLYFQSIKGILGFQTLLYQSI